MNISMMMLGGLVQTSKWQIQKPPAKFSPVSSALQALKTLLRSLRAKHQGKGDNGQRQLNGYFQAALEF